MKVIRQLMGLKPKLAEKTIIRVNSHGRLQSLLTATK